MERVQIPQFVDELPQLWFWEIDEALFIVLGLFVGIIIDWMIIATIVGMLIASLFGRFKQGQNRGLLMHMAYWYGIMPFKGIWCSISFQRHWVK